MLRRLELTEAEGLRYSSSRISPGGIRTQPDRSLVIVFDADFVGISVLPPKRDPILVVDSNAVPAGLVALQQFEPITGWDSEIVQPTRRVNQPQLPLDAAPQFARDRRAGRVFRSRNRSADVSSAND